MKYRVDMSRIEYPERVRLARLPTALEPLVRTGELLGVELYIKRDDTTGTELSGNKIRKLEFLFADARARGADTIITCGGEQSNHCRATALAAARLGLRSVLLLRTDDPANPPALSSNLLLDRLAGAELVWISRAEWARRAELLKFQAERVRAAGRTPYIIPEGGSNAIGSWGYVLAAQELADDLARLPAKPTTIVYAAGSGGTGAGLLVGSKLLGLDKKDIRMTGICVCDDRQYFVDTIHRICSDLDQQFGCNAGVEPTDIDIIDGYIGLGYAESQPAELEVLCDMVRREAIVLDPVYTGKAFYGLVKELESDSARFGQRVVFLHTGGIFGLFPLAEKLAQIVN
ncbi:MAG: D-cysteine desulfhydrase family protein [Proteobacteria bacterium]|nr:D-cysteine desulfhydrase family protein [Pseudomonadota bacterium]